VKRVKDIKRLEELARKKGYTSLGWFSPPDLMKKTGRFSFEFEKTKFILYGCPKNYRGPYSDYKETIIAQIMDKTRSRTRGYKWTNTGTQVKKWVME